MGSGIQDLTPPPPPMMAHKQEAPSVSSDQNALPQEAAEPKPDRPASHHQQQHKKKKKKRWKVGCTVEIRDEDGAVEQGIFVKYVVDNEVVVKFPDGVRILNRKLVRRAKERPTEAEAEAEADKSNATGESTAAAKPPDQRQRTKHLDMRCRVALLATACMHPAQMPLLLEPPRISLNLLIAQTSHQLFAAHSNAVCPKPALARHLAVCWLLPCVSSRVHA